MSSLTSLLRTTVLLSIVTTVKSVTSWDTAPKSNNSSTLIKRLTQPVNRVEGGKFDNQKRVFKSNRKLNTTFDDNKKAHTMMADNSKQYHDFEPNFHPQNAFKCPPCVCKNISSNSVSVFCFNCSITSIPESWSVEINEIIINNCKKLEVLDLRTVLMYSSLTRVKIMTSSLVKVFSSIPLNVSSTVIDINFEMNAISTVEESCFFGFPNLRNLSLSYNLIEALTREMFTGLRSLRYLSVAGNNINFIADDTFDDIGNLVKLDISQNKIIYTYNDLLPVRIFIPLKNLEELYIFDVCQRDTYLCGSYPNKALQVLTNLKHLIIDGLDSRGPGPEIKSLVHLRHLIITQPDSDSVIDESYFDNVPSITTLEFQFSNQYVPPKAFANLTNVVNFMISYSSINGNHDLCEVLSDIKYLLKYPLKYLTLRFINGRDLGCKELHGEHAEYLKSLNLIELDLSGNYLVYLSPDFIAMLPQTLQKIDLSSNNFPDQLYYSFGTFPKDLIEINLNNQYDVYNCRENDKDIIHRIKVKNKLISKNYYNPTSNETIYSFQDQTVETIKVSKYFLPPNLQILRADCFRSFGSRMWDNLDTDCNYSLETLSLADNEFNLRMDDTFLTSIETADFSNNNWRYFEKDFFPENNSLKYFSISNNLLGDALESNIENLFFANTKKLIALDISRNSITVIANDYFRNLFKLRILDISENKLQMINISFSHMTELRFLDFRSNAITSISKLSRDDLDLIAADHRVYLDLTSNPLLCTCEGLELMKWMAFTNVYILNQDFLVCRNEFHEVHEIGNIVESVETLQRQCTSKIVIILTCVFSIIVFGILLITSLMYRYRWKLRYLRSIALVKLFGARPFANNMIGYRFDAYILYTDDTRRFVLRDCVRELEEKRDHRLCIEERDFLPGIYNVSQIVSSVQNSTKTVAMVTPEFYEGEYSEYCVKMALMEEIFMRRSVLFLCVCEPTDDKDLSHDLLIAMKKSKYLEYPPRDEATDEIIDEFWNQFSRVIGRNEREEI